MAAISEILARELGCAQAYVENIITLLDEGNTIPFIARYRKEQHGSMDDTTLRKLEDRLTYLRSLDQRRQEVKKAVDGDEFGRALAKKGLGSDEAWPKNAPVVTITG